MNWETDDREALWAALRKVVLHWCGRGIRVFRVDNPHTKPAPFWEWLIAEVRAKYPETIFLSEAFTRPAPMTTLAKLGFGQSYTYFTWKNTKAELVELVEQIRSWSSFYRPNMWPNTPDILHEYLQEGGRPAFESRLVLAATISRVTASTPATRPANPRRCGRAARNTSTRRSSSSDNGG